MKKVLITGAAGCLGKQVIKYLLSEGKYEITALDLKNKTSFRALRRYHRRVNIIYGDVANPLLIDSLVKENDYIIHLASIKPSMAVLKEKVTSEIDYKGTENIVRAITFYNPSCFLIYPSTTNVYGKNEKVTTATKTSNPDNNFYVQNKLNSEKLIKDKLSNFVIYRIPTILTTNFKDEFIYNTPRNEETEFITAADCAYALVKTIDTTKTVNKKTYNLGGGPTCIAPFKYVLENILNIRGLSNSYLWSLLLLEKDFHGHVYTDSAKINDILNYQSESIESYLMELKRKTGLRLIQRFLAEPFAYFVKRKK